MTQIFRGLLLLTGAFVLVACDGDADSLGRKGKGGSDNPAADAGDGTKLQCDATRGVAHIGFGNTDLVKERVEAAQGADRARLKPYSALQTEFKRVTGQSPASLAAASGTFGSPQDRWFIEPNATSFTVTTSYAVAFEACLGVTGKDAAYAAAPDAASAASVCTNLTRKFWSRVAAPEEIDACAQVATTDSSAESDPRRRWAYACAAVLSASGFMSY